MKEASRSKHSGRVVKKKSSSGCLTIKKKVGDSVGGVSGFRDSSSRNLSRPSTDKKRRRVVESDSESSDYSPETTRQKVDKLNSGSAVHKGAYFENREFETEKRVSTGLDVFEFDEYDGFDYSRIRKDANRGRHRWNSYGQSGDEMESGNGGSRRTHDARSQSEMEDDDFDLPLAALSKKYRSNEPIKLQGKNGVMKVIVNKNKQKEAEDQKEAQPIVLHKKKSRKNGDHRAHGDEQSSRTDDINTKDKGELKYLKPMVEKSMKEVNEIDTVMQSKSNSSIKKESRVKAGSGTEKKRLREKIKNMLLDAGWTIDYRPRKNKNYMDAIYTNPSGSAYWSIIKAYQVLQKEEGDNNEDGGNFTPLPVEILGKLERQNLKKMEKELKKERKDEGGNRNGKRSMVSDQEEELNSNFHGRKSRRLARSTLLVRDSNKVLNSEKDGFALYSGKRSILSWLIDSEVVNVSEHVEYMNGRRTRVLKKGRITRDGIHCGCCNKILSVLGFEQHSGSKLCSPFENMFLESGKSLMQCQIDAWSKLGQKGFYKVDVDGDDPNDDTCSVCGDGGDLICCDGCPSTFHQSCLDIEMLPEDDWLCPNCSCKYCKMAAGNCTSLLTCCLCHKKYHESCRQEPHELNSLDLSFCGQECHQVYIGLQKLVGVKHEVDSGFSWSLIHRSDSDSHSSERVEWNCMLAVAMSVMEECFLPFTDSRSGINLIRNVVFNCGSNLSRLNYSSFYTAILERGDEVVCAASIRIHGTQVAEMPFIGTRHIYRRQGMCRRLLSAIESALWEVGVDKLIIPAVAEHMKTWTDVFGFQPLKEQLKSMNMNMLVFPGTDMLQKPLGNNTVEVDNVSALSKKPKLIPSKSATTDSSSQGFCVPLNDIDVSKETLTVNSLVKDESPCDSPLQPPGREYDSVHSHSNSNSKVGGIDVRNGNGANPFPDQVPDPSPNVIGPDIPCESHSQPTLQQSEKESDSTHSHSNSSIGKIPVQNGNGTNNPIEGSCGSERNGKEKERGIPGAADLSNNTLDHSALSRNSNVVELSDKTGITDSGSGVLCVPLDDGCSLDAIHAINPSVKDKSCCKPQVQLPGKEFDSKVDMQDDDRISPLPTHVHDPIQLSHKESFSSVHVDVQTKGNNTIEVDGHIVVSKKSELISCNINDKNATGCVESSVPLRLDSHVNSESRCDPKLQPPGKESDSRVEEQDCNESKSSCGNGRGIPVAVSDCKAANGLNDSLLQNDSGTDPKGNKTVDGALSKKTELISSNVVEFSDTTSSLDSQQVGVCLDASNDTLPITSPVKDDISISVHRLRLESKLQLPEKESDSICCSHSGDKIAVSTPSKNESFSCVDVQTDSMVLETDINKNEIGAVSDSEAVNDLSGCNTMEVDDVSALSKKPSDKNVSGDNACLTLPGKESDSHSDSKVDEMALQNGHGTNPLLAQVHDAIPSDIPCQSHEQIPPPPSRDRILQQQAKESDSIDSHSDPKVDEADVQNGDQVHDAIPSGIPRESHKQVPASSSLQQPGNSLSVSIVDGTPGKGVNDNIQCFQGKEDSCESESNPKEKQIQIPHSEAGMDFSHSDVSSNHVIERV